MDATALLPNVTWHTLTGPHARFAAGAGEVRRYAIGFSPILGFADPRRPDFETLAPYCEPGEHFYCESWTGAATAGWRIDVERTMFKMVWTGAAPPGDEAPEAQPLLAVHAQQALELATLTRPGPFGPRTLELGDYFGCFEDGELIAMAGERMHAGSLREISGVCTRPGHQGRGLARRLMLKLIARQMQRSETPFLHVMSDNTVAHGLYERMGFSDHQEVVVRVVTRL